MRHHGEEVALRPTRHLGRLARFLSLRRRFVKLLVRELDLHRLILQQLRLMLELLLHALLLDHVAPDCAITQEREEKGTESTSGDDEQDEAARCAAPGIALGEEEPFRSLHHANQPARAVHDPLAAPRGNDDGGAADAA